MINNSLTKSAVQDTRSSLGKHPRNSFDGVPRTRNRLFLHEGSSIRAVMANNSKGLRVFHAVSCISKTVCRVINSSVQFELLVQRFLFEKFMVALILMLCAVSNIMLG